MTEDRPRTGDGAPSPNGEESQQWRSGFTAGDAPRHVPPPSFTRPPLEKLKIVASVLAMLLVAVPGTVMAYRDWSDFRHVEPVVAAGLVLLWGLMILLGIRLLRDHSRDRAAREEWERSREQDRPGQRSGEG